LHVRLSRLAALTASLLILWLSGCGGTDPVEWEAAGVSASPTPTPAKPPTEDKLVVYLDTSASMAGYVSQNGQNVFGSTLRALRDTVTSFKTPLDVAVRYVDVSVTKPDPDGALALQKASINPKIYGGNETDLAGAINEFGGKPAPAAAHVAAATASGEAEAEQTPPARIHVLITDGVQSKKSQNAKCLKGSDSTCVREKIIDLLKAGWGAYVIGLRSQFHGTIYSEVSGAKMQYNSYENRPQSFRPFYLYIFSPDRAALDDFVGVLRERLRPIAPPDTLRVVALTSRYSERAVKAEAVVPKESEDAVELGGQEDDPARITLGVDPNVTDASPLPLTVAVEVPWSKQVLDSGSKQELAAMVRWEVVAVYPAPGGAAEGGKRYPVVKVKTASGVAPDGQGRLPVELTVGWPRSTQAPAWGVYRLQGRLDFGEDKDPLPWIRQWSTSLDTTVDTGDRTLNLESVLTSLLRNPVLEQQTVAEVYLRVGPQ
jgi:hypothetical protein